MLEFAPRARRYGARLARLLNIIGVPAPKSPTIETCWLPKEFSFVQHGLFNSLGSQFLMTVRQTPEFELCGVPISLIFEVYLIL